MYVAGIGCGTISARHPRTEGVNGTASRFAFFCYAVSLFFALTFPFSTLRFEPLALSCGPICSLRSQHSCLRCPESFSRGIASVGTVLGTIAI